MDCNKSLYEIVRDTSMMYPHNPALYYENKLIKYKKFIKEVDKLAAFLHYIKVEIGDIVTVCLPNIPDAVYALYAINKLGAICYEVHPKTPCIKMEQYLKKTNSKVLLVLDIFSYQYLSLCEKLNLTIITFNPFKGYNMIKSIYCECKSPKKGVIKYHHQYKGKVKSYQWSPNQTSVLLNSGGTSGEPKIIELSTLSINRLASNGTEILGIKDGSGVFMLAVLPMFHGFGLCMGIHATLMYGACASLMMKFHTKDTIKLINKNYLTIIIGVPAIFKALLKNPKFYTSKLKNITTAYVGGDFVSTDLVHEFNEVMKKYGSQARLYEGYGLTETVTVCSVNTNKFNRERSVGKAVTYAKIGIVDPLTNEFLGPNKDGEIVVSGDILMNGYFHDEELTKKTLKILSDNNKWVLTGDYGHLDEDNYLYFKQRLKRIVKVSGIIVCPSEIENVVSQLMDVHEVFATSTMHDKKDNMIVLFIVKDYHSILSDEELNKIINKKIKDEVSVYAVPSKIIYLDALPKTEIGKIDGKKIEDKYL